MADLESLAREAGVVAAPKRPTKGKPRGSSLDALAQEAGIGVPRPTPQAPLPRIADPGHRSPITIPVAGATAGLVGARVPGRPTAAGVGGRVAVGTPDQAVASAIFDIIRGRANAHQLIEGARSAPAAVYGNVRRNIHEATRPAAEAQAALGPKAGLLGPAASEIESSPVLQHKIAAETIRNLDPTQIPAFVNALTADDPTPMAKEMTTGLVERIAKGDEQAVVQLMGMVNAGTLGAAFEWMGGLSSLKPKAKAPPVAVKGIKAPPMPEVRTPEKMDIPGYRFRETAGPKRSPISDDTLRLGAAARSAGLSEPQAIGAQVGAANILRKGREAGKPIGGITTAKKPKTGAMRQEQAATFYSKLQRVVEDKIPNRASADQIRKTLEGAGVKPEEMEWTRTNRFLSEHEGPVSKQDLLDHITENQITVEETVLGEGDAKSRAADNAMLDANQKLRRMMAESLYLTQTDAANILLSPETNASKRLLTLPEPELIEAAKDYWAKLADSQQSYRDRNPNPTPTKFGQYTTPGGKNYRELLLRLPEKKGDPLEGYTITKDNGQAYGKDVWWARRDGREISVSVAPGAPESAARALLAKKIGGEIQGSFTQSHFDQPNVLAHVRFDERTGPNGEKILHVAEVQSDWHQKGRSGGYQGQAPDTSKWWAERISDEAFAIYDEDNHGLGTVRAPNAEVAMEMARTAPDLMNSARHQVGPKVPDAPFKKTWHELAMKRMIRYASEHGFDEITWDTGATQADRYDLSKQVERVDYHPENQTLEAFDKTGLNVIRENGITSDKLADYIGKEAAERIVNSPTESYRATDGTLVHSLQGVDLRVGGEGMKGFYDKILPDFVNKHTKKWGGKVEAGEVGSGHGQAQETAILRMLNDIQEDPDLVIIPDDVDSPMEWHGRVQGVAFRMDQARRAGKPWAEIMEGLAREGLGEEASAVGERAGVSHQGVVVGEVGTRYGFRWKEGPFAGELVETPESQVQSFGSLQEASKWAVSQGLRGKVDMVPLPNKTVPAHRLRLTPEMKAAVLNEGQPLFQGGDTPKPPSGTGLPDEWVRAALDRVQEAGLEPENFVNPRGKWSWEVDDPHTWSRADFLEHVDETIETWREHQKPYRYEGDLAQRSTPGVKGTYDPRTRTIEFIKGKADFSTTVHEVAHYFHDWLKDDAKYGKLITDTYGDLTDVKGAEAFARHYEQYLRSGKAPNPGLKNVFAAIAQWMKDIYQNWRHGKPSKEVRAIFDEIVGEQTPEVQELIRRFDEATGSKSEVPPRAGAPETGKNFTEGAAAEGTRGPGAAPEPPRGAADVPDTPKPKSDKPATSVALRQSEERGILPETPGVRHDSELAAEAERLGLGTKEGAARLLEESKTRELQDYENFGIGARLAAIDEEMVGLDTGSPEYQALLDEAKALRSIRGTETARALRSRGILAASDYTPSGFVAAIENATGKTLRDAQRRKFRDMAEEYRALKNHLDEIQAEYDRIRTRKRSGGGTHKATGTKEAIDNAWGDVFDAMGGGETLKQLSNIDVKMRHPLAVVIGEYLAKEPNTAKALKAAVADIKAKTGITIKPKDAHDLWAGYRSDRVGKKNPLSEEVLYVRRQARKVRADMERELVRAGRSFSEKLGEALSGASVEVRLWNPVARATDQGSNVAEQIVQASTSGISRPIASQMAKALKLDGGFKMLTNKQRAQVIARYGADVKEALSEATSGYGTTGPASHFAGQADAFVRAKVQLDYAGEQAAALTKDRGFDFGETLDQIRDPYLGGPLKFDEARKLHDAMREHGDLMMLTNANLLSRGRAAIRQSIVQNKAMPRPVKAMSLAVVDLATSFTKVLANVADRTAQYQHPSYGIARGAYEFYRAIAGKDLLPQQRAMFLRNGSAMFVRAGVGGVLHWLGYQLAVDPDKREGAAKLLNEIGLGKVDMGHYWGPAIIEGRSKDGKRTGNYWIDEGAWSQLGGSVAALTAGYRDALIDQSDLNEEKKAGLKEQLRYAFLTDNPLMGNVKRAQQVFSGDRELGDTLADWVIGLYYPGGLREWARIQQVQEGKFGVRPSKMFDGEAKTWQERAQIMLDALESLYAKRFPNLEKVDVPHVGVLSLPVKGHKGMAPIGVPYTGESSRPRKGGTSSLARVRRYVGTKRP